MTAGALTGRKYSTPMFGLGMTELLVILGIALLVFGPKKLPDLATSLGKAIRQFRRATTDLQDQLELDENVKRPINELKAALRDEPAPVVPPAPSPAASTPAVSKPPPVGSIAVPAGAVPAGVGAAVANAPAAEAAPAASSKKD